MALKIHLTTPQGSIIVYMKQQNIRLGRLGARSNSMRCLVILAMMALGLLSKVASGQPSPQGAAEQMHFSTPRTQEVSKEATQQELTDLARNASWSLLTAKATQLGFTAKEGSLRIQATGEARGRAAVSARIDVFPYAKEGSSDSAALVNVSAGDERYSALLVATNDDFENATEWKVEDNKVVEAHSWWHCVVTQLAPQCGITCGATLATCPKPDWKALVGCMAKGCGPCFVQVVYGCIHQ